MLRAELAESLTVMINALCEVRLIAPENLAFLSVNVVQRLTTSEDPTHDFPELRDKLYEAMRTDLGEPEHQHIDVPEIAAKALERDTGAWSTLAPSHPSDGRSRRRGRG